MLIARFIARSCAVLTVGFSLIAALAPNPAWAAKDLEGVTLRVACWGGSWLKRIQSTIEPQLVARGAKVEYVVGNPHDNLAKLVAARGQAVPFDIIEFSENNRTDMNEAGVLAELDYSQVSNAAPIDPRYRLKNMVAHSSTIDGIVYNADKFKELGVPAPKTYADLANPKLKGRVTFGEPTVIQGVKGIVAIAYENGGNEKNLKPGLEAINKLAPGSFYKSSTKLFAQFKAGDIWAAHWHVGWVIRGRKADIPLAFAMPKIQDKHAVISNVWLGVVKGTSNAKAAQAFINEYLASKPQEEIGRLTGARPVNQAAADALKSDPLLAEFLPLTSKDYAEVYYSDLTSIDMAALVDQWNRTVSQKAK